MSTQSAGLAIRESRLKAGLSQEKLSEGICSALSLSRIENGTAGVSPATFQALMAHAGAPCEAFPIFANRNDFDCFYSLKRVKFYVDSWQLKEAYEELEKIEKWGFANNKFYYQEWLLLHSRLQFRSGMGDHSKIHDMLLHAIHISRPNIDFVDFRNLLLSINEIELLIYYAQEELYVGKPEICLSICMQLTSYLENSKLNFLEKDRLLIENAVVYSKYLLAIRDYDQVVAVTTTQRNKLVTNSDDTSRFELAFLLGLGHYYRNEHEKAVPFFKAVFYSAHSIGSCYATICANYLFSEFEITIHNDIENISAIALTAFPHKKNIDTVGLSDGTYDLFSPDIITIGRLIRELRVEHGISQQSLCQGLCSKSKLSKIENDTLQPSAILAETLLQRLGISERVFTFYDSVKEAALYELRARTALIPQNESAQILASLEQMEMSLTKDDVLYRQYILYRRALTTQDNGNKIDLLRQALCLTQPSMNLLFTRKDYLSWCELNILTHLCEAYVRSTSPLKGIVMFLQMLDYLFQTPRDILSLKRLLPIFVSRLTYNLCIQQQFTELRNMLPYFSNPAMKSYLHGLGTILANYAQVLGKIEEYSLIPLYTHYAYSLLLLTNSEHAHSFKDEMARDWNIHVL